AADANVTWSIPSRISINQFHTLNLDISFGIQYISVNGTLQSATGSSPATGTCFVKVDNGVYCNLQVDQASFNVDLSPSLTGTISGKDANGAPMGAALLTLTNIR